MNIETIRHSLSHIMAFAVQELYPGAKFAIGPAIDNGFYYDFDFKNAELTQNLNAALTQVKEGDLPKIEEKMRELLKKNIQFKQKTITKTEAKKLFKDQPYKLELIEEIPEKEVSVYKSGDFIDLCAGPHIKSTREIPADAFKLGKLAGAYWRGSEKNAMLTRIYGLSFASKKELEDYLELQQEAEKRDHRILGQKMDLFLMDEEVGSGLPIWTPKGTTLRKIIEDYLYEELKKHGYQWLVTPHIANLNLWKTSGHWNFYRENMYPPMVIDEDQYMLKPMNCPFHVKVFNSKIRSYKDLPIKFAEFGTVYRYERSGVLHGLTRVRGFTQDDAHIWCEPSQLNEELTKLLEISLKLLKDFGFSDYDVYLATRPEKYIGDEEIWEKATNSLKYAMEQSRLDYQVDEGGGVFYGPKIDIKIKDCLGRPWQCTTIQVDFNLPEQFDINYVDKNGKKQKPIMIHRALLGALERFIGVLLEHYAGALPFWLSPEQIWIIPVGSDHRQYAQDLGQQLEKEGFRVRVHNKSETVSKKIREGEIQKIPYLLVVGEKELQNKTVRIRERGKGDIGEIQIDQFLNQLKAKNK